MFGIDLLRYIERRVVKGENGLALLAEKVIGARKTLLQQGNTSLFCHQCMTKKRKKRIQTARNHNTHTYSNARKTRRMSRDDAKGINESLRLKKEGWQATGKGIQEVSIKGTVTLWEVLLDLFTGKHLCS